MVFKFNLSSFVLSFALITGLLVFHSTPAQADSGIFDDYIPCAENGNCGREAGEVLDEEVGEIARELTPYEERPPEPIPPEEAMCTSSTPLEDAPFNCKTAICNAGVIEIDFDDNDIHEVAEICHKCSEGEIVVDPAKEQKPLEPHMCIGCSNGNVENLEENTACVGDGTEAQACFTCQGGDCKLPACKVETTPWKVTLAAELDKIGFINKIINGLNEVGSKLPVPGGFEISKPTIAGSVENGDECCGECTADKDPIGQYVQLDGTLGIGAEIYIGKKIDVEFDEEFEKWGYGIELELDAEAKVGIFLNMEVKGGASGKYNLHCDQGCGRFFAEAGAKLSGGVSAEVKEAEVEIIFASEDYDIIALVPDEEGNPAGASAMVVLGSGSKLALSKSIGSSCSTDTCLWTLGAGALELSVSGRVEIFGWREFGIPTITWEKQLWSPYNGTCG